MRKTLMVPLKNRAQFLDVFFEKGDIGGIFVAGVVDVELGDEVDLMVTFKEEEMQFRIRGEVRWRRSKGSARSLLPGVGIEFLPSEFKVKQLLLEYAMGREVRMIHRASHRFPAAIDVKTKIAGAKTEAHTDDVSGGGALLLLEVPLCDVDDIIEVILKPPGRIFGISLKARVAWVRMDAPSGIGIEFLFTSAKKRTQVEDMVSELKTRAIEELLVRVPQATARDDGFGQGAEKKK